MDFSLYAMMIRAQSGVITAEKINKELARSSQNAKLFGAVLEVPELNVGMVQKSILESHYGNKVLTKAVLNESSLADTYRLLHRRFASFRTDDYDHQKKDLDDLLHKPVDESSAVFMGFSTSEAEIYFSNIPNTRNPFLLMVIKGLLLAPQSVERKSDIQKVYFLDSKIEEIYRQGNRYADPGNGVPEYRGSGKKK